MDRITISRWFVNGGTDGITITIESDKYSIIYRGEMKMDEFARCLTGKGNCYINREIANGFVEKRGDE